MNEYLLNEDAKEDLWRIYEYGRNTFGSTQADKYYNMMLLSFERIASNNLMFPISQQNLSYRSCVCGVDTIYFKINNNVVEIMAIIGMQNF